MASVSLWKKLQEEASCHICWNYYIDPCILDCGHSFCMACVFQCWKDFPDISACPQCSTSVERKNCRQNRLLANVVEIAKQLSSQVKEKREGEKVCEKHLEPPRTVFCVEDQIVFCEACEGSKQHRDHHVTPVEVAAQLYKDQYSSCIEELKKERAEMVKHKFRIVEWREQLQKSLVTEHGTVSARFQLLHDFLKKQGDYLLVRLESIPRQIAEETNYDNPGHRFLEIFSLESNIRKLEEKASQPVHEFLQDALTTLNRYQRSALLPVPPDFSEGLKWGFWELLELSAMMKGLLNYLTDILRSALSVTRANVTLDQGSSHPQLLLSPDGKSVKWRHVPLRLPNLPKRFQKLCCVTGCQEFTIGRHLWDVTVKGQGEWAVGVAKSSVKRKGFFNLCVQEGIFAVGKLEQRYRVVNVPHSPFLSQDGELTWIQVSLNCSAGQVNFYDMTRAMRIFGFTEIGCFHEAFLPFFWLNGEIRLTINNK